VQKWYPGASYGTTVISATMSSPSGMKFDLLGNLVIADTSYQRILSFGLTCRKLFWEKKRKFFDLSFLKYVFNVLFNFSCFYNNDRSTT